ncbi:hypothetical protein [Shewanella sp. DC2-4]|uniref:hypothetical protein n=1 Tax=Shewanella sp. DC2-4 TaxID=2739431 RepID=UPI001C26D5B9|nr:hypothetical protein [Shewanella sp. DC2-4]
MTQSLVNMALILHLQSIDPNVIAIYDGQSFLNDWLKQEFSERVSQKRKIILTDKLSQGLKIVHAAVTKEMEEEERLIAEIAMEHDESTVIET